jgi:hypothetical protein
MTVVETYQGFHTSFPAAIYVTDPLSAFRATGAAHDKERQRDSGHADDTGDCFRSRPSPASTHISKLATIDAAMTSEASILRLFK